MTPVAYYSEIKEELVRLRFQSSVQLGILLREGHLKRHSNKTFKRDKAIEKLNQLKSKIESAEMKLRFLFQSETGEEVKGFL